MPREKFTIDTNLKAVGSPLTAEFIDEYLRTKRTGALSGIGEAVISAAKTHGINASYIVAHAAVETGWGTSKIYRVKNNLFGWSAFDATPFSSAKGFPNRETCIDFVMGRINALYLTPGGRYYRRSACLGKPNPGGYGMNVHYASDPRWGRSIATVAEQMEQAFLRTAPSADVRSEVEDATSAMPAVEALLVRARSAAGRQTRYQLGEGGMNPGAAMPGTPSRGCDCSGFVCWCFGIRRQTNHPLYVRFNSGWINTDAMVHDAQHPTGFFTQLEGPSVGCMVVFPSKRPQRAYGHVGLVTAVRNGKVHKVIHCSSGNFTALGDAIQETGPTVFEKPETIYAWYDGIV